MKREKFGMPRDWNIEKNFFPARADCGKLFLFGLGVSESTKKSLHCNTFWNRNSFGEGEPRDST